MAVELRPATAVLVLVAVLLAGSFGSIVVTEASGGTNDAAVSTIPLEDGDGQLWLYTSRGLSFERATLAINVVVYGDPAEVRQHLLEGGDGNWSETNPDEQDIAPGGSGGAINSTNTRWEIADGTNRYAYLGGVGGGAWLDEEYQVHDGSYLGSRHHIRAYTAPGGGEWTAMQAHHEHWDWFMGRHIVTSVDESQSYVEQEFVEEPGAPGVTRVPVGGEGQPGFDGWLTVVDVRSPGSQAAAALLVAFLGMVRTRVGDAVATLRARYPEEDARVLLLAAGVAGVLVFVRLAGIALEGAFDVQPKAFAFLLYPVVFAGLPVAAYLLSRPLDRPRAFAGASVGFLAGVLVDYSYLGVTHVPLDVLVHRGALAVALGLIAVGASRVERRADDQTDHVRFGVLLWLVATILPLLQHTSLPV